MIENALRLAVLVCLGFFLATAHLLATDSNNIKDWIEQLRRPNAKLQIQAAAKLAEIGNLGILADSSIEPLANCLQNSDSNVRLYASFALGRIEADKVETVSLLVPLLLDPDEHVRYSAEWSIAEVAKSASSHQYDEQVSRRLLGVFASAENQMARGAFQERHVLAVRLARSKLENQAKSIHEFSSTESSPPPMMPTPNVSVISDNNLLVSMSLYEANDLAGRLQIVDRMAKDSGFDNSLRLAVLKHELHSDDTRVADYAIAHWQTTGKRLLSTLFVELNESDLNAQYAIRVISGLAPIESHQLGQLCNLAQSTQLEADLRIATLNAIASAAVHPELDQRTIAEVLLALQAIMCDGSESIDVRKEAIAAIAGFSTNADTSVPMLLALSAQLDLPAEVRKATAKALATLAPSSHEAVGIIVQWMTELSVDDDLFVAYVEILGDFGSTGAIGCELIVKGLRANEVITRIKCATALEKFGSWAANAASSLVDRITDPDEEVAVKNQSANALKQMGQIACTLLLEQVQNPDSSVREHVLRALTTVACSNPILVAPCLSRLMDSDEAGAVQAAAATALGSIGVLARQAVPALLDACDDSQPTELRAAAIIALSRIDPEQATIVIQSSRTMQICSSKQVLRMPFISAAIQRRV